MVALRPPNQKLVNLTLKNTELQCCTVGGKGGFASIDTVLCLCDNIIREDRGVIPSVMTIVNPSVKIAKL